MLENVAVSPGIILGSTYLQRLNNRLKQLVLNEENVIVFPELVDLEALLIVNPQNVVVV